MFGFVFRTIGLWFTAGGVVALVLDGTRSIAAGGVRLTPLFKAWQNVSPASFGQARTWVASHASPQVWTGIELVLGLPAWAVLLFIGLGLIWLGSGRSRATVVLGRPQGGLEPADIRSNRPEI